MWAEEIARAFNASMECGILSYRNHSLEMDPVAFNWTFRAKDASTFNGILWKALCYLCGNRELLFRDFDPKTLYAPMVQHKTVCIFLADVAARKLIVLGANIVNDYLYGDMDRPIIMKQPTDSSGKV